MPKNPGAMNPAGGSGNPPKPHGAPAKQDAGVDLPGGGNYSGSTGKQTGSNVGGKGGSSHNPY